MSRSRQLFIIGWTQLCGQATGQISLDLAKWPKLAIVCPTSNSTFYYYYYSNSIFFCSNSTFYYYYHYYYSKSTFVNSQCLLLLASCWFTRIWQFHIVVWEHCYHHCHEYCHGQCDNHEHGDQEDGHQYSWKEVLGPSEPQILARVPSWLWTASFRPFIQASRSWADAHEIEKFSGNIKVRNAVRRFSRNPYLRNTVRGEVIWIFVTDNKEELDILVIRTFGGTLVPFLITTLMTQPGATWKQHSSKL